MLTYLKVFCLLGGVSMALILQLWLIHCIILKKQEHPSDEESMDVTSKSRKSPRVKKAKQMPFAKKGRTKWWKLSKSGNVDSKKSKKKEKSKKTEKSKESVERKSAESLEEPVPDYHSPFRSLELAPILSQSQELKSVTAAPPPPLFSSSSPLPTPDPTPDAGDEKPPFASSPPRKSAPRLEPLQWPKRKKPEPSKSIHGWEWM
ncbi:hypothetical protein Aduo_010791 [Ancylostoma duodenale]